MNTSVHHHTILVLGEEGNMSSLFLVSQVIDGVYLSLCAVPCDVDGCFAFQLLLIVSQFAAVNPLYERMNVSRYELLRNK